MYICEPKNNKQGEYEIRTNQQVKDPFGEAILSVVY